MRGVDAVALLRAARDAAAALEIYKPPKGLSVRSRLRGFLREDLLLDEPQPLEHWSAWREGDPLIVGFGLAPQGCFVFRTRWLGRTEVTHQHVLAVPDEIKPVQRRLAFRAVPSIDHPARCVLFGDEGCPPTTLVENVSIIGIGLSFAKNPGVAVGDSIWPVELVLGELYVLRLGGVIRSIRPSPDGRVIVGLEWQALKMQDERALQDYVLCCQRCAMHPTP